MYEACTMYCRAMGCWLIMRGVKKSEDLPKILQNHHGSKILHDVYSSIIDLWGLWDVTIMEV